MAASSARLGWRVIPFFAVCRVVVVDAGRISGNPVEILGMSGAMLTQVAILATNAAGFIAGRNAHHGPMRFTYTLPVSRKGRAS